MLDHPVGSADRGRGPQACRLLAVVVAVATSSAWSLPAQSWQPAGTTVPVSFGSTGDLLVRDGLDLLGFDDVSNLTIFSQPGGWVTQPSGIPPRLRPALMAAGPGRPFLFGGIDAGGAHLADLWRFDLLAGTWVLLPPGPVGPVARFGARAAPNAAGYPLLFGGQSAAGFPNDSWFLLGVPGGAAWFAPVSAVQPPGRIGHAMAAGPGGSIVMFGGINTAPLGDTWVFRSSPPVGWSQQLGLGPPATADARMVFDSARDLVVLLHPNGETWEWNEFRWRRVGILSAPAWSGPALSPRPGQPAGITAWQPAGALLQRFDYQPGPAEFGSTLDVQCRLAPSMPLLELVAFERSLPLLGQPFHLRVLGTGSNSLAFGAFELPAGVSLSLGCGCALGLSGAGAVVVFLPGTGGFRDWISALPSNPTLYGAAIDLQAFAFDPISPCGLGSTNRGTMVAGL